MTVIENIENLQSADWRTRMDAADALAGVIEPEAVQALVNALEDSDWGVRRCALHALGNGDPSVVVEKIAEKIADHHYIVRETAASIIRSMGRRGTKQFLSILENRKKYPPDSRLLVLDYIISDSLSVFTDQVDSIQNSETDSRIRDYFRYYFPGSVEGTGIEEELEEQYSSNNPFPDTETLLGYLRNGNAHQRMKAAVLLTEKPAERVIPALINALNDPAEFVRYSAGSSLQSIGAAVLPQLEAALEQSRGRSSEIIARLMDSIRKSMEQEQIRRAATGFDTRKRRRSIQDLDFNNPENLPVLVSLLHDPDPPVFEAFINKAKEECGYQLLPEIKKMLEERIKEMETPEGRERHRELTNRLEHIRTEQFNECEDANYRIGTKEGAERCDAFSREMDSLETELGKTAALISVLEKSWDSDIGRLLVRIIRADMPEQIQAKNILVEKSIRLFGSILTLVESENYDDKKAGIEILKEIGSPRALENMLLLRDDPDVRIRELVSPSVPEGDSEETRKDKSPSCPENGSGLLSWSDNNSLDAARELQIQNPGFLNGILQTIKVETSLFDRLSQFSILRNLRDKRALKTLLEYTRDDNEYIRDLAVQGVIALEDKSTAGFLAGLLIEKEKYMFGAARALYRMGDPRGIGGLMNFLQMALQVMAGDRPEPDSLSLIGWELQDIPGAISILVVSGGKKFFRLLDDIVQAVDDEHVCWKIMQMLEEYPHVREMVHLMKEWARYGGITVRKMALRIIVQKWEIDDPDFYLELIKDEDRSLREYAAEGLFRFINKNNVHAVFCNLPYTCMYKNMKNIRDYLEGSEEMLMRLLDDPDEGIRARAIECLCRLKIVPAVPAILCVLDGESRRLEDVAIRALESMGYWPF